MRLRFLTNKRKRNKLKIGDTDMLKKLFAKKEPEFDPDELLPFCFRCRFVGAIAEVDSNFCHMCGSGGTCINLKRRTVVALRTDQSLLEYRTYDRYLDSLYEY